MLGLDFLIGVAVGLTLAVVSKAIYSWWSTKVSSAETAVTNAVGNVASNVVSTVVSDVANKL